MTVKSGTTWEDGIVLLDGVGAIAVPDAGPTGTLYVNGLPTADIVAITGSNPYKWSVVLPSLSPGDRVSMYISATISSVVTAAFVMADQVDTKLVSDLQDAPAVDVSSLALEATVQEILTDTGTTIPGTLSSIKGKTDTIPTNPAAVGSQMDLVSSPNALAVASIQSGLATETLVQLVKDVTDKVLTTLVQDGLVWKFTTNALENAPITSVDLTPVTDAIAGVSDQVDALPQTAAQPGDKMDIVDAPNALAVGVFSDAVLDTVIESGITLRESIRIANALLGGKASGGDTPTLEFRNLAGDKVRVRFTADIHGNRTAVVLDVSE